MKVGISIKLDVTKLDKTKFFKGAKGTYVDLVTFVNLDEKGQYGDNGVISQQVSKEDKASGVEMPIAGNSTVFWRDDSQQQAPQQQQYQQQPQQQPDDLDQDIPF